MSVNGMNNGLPDRTNIIGNKQNPIEASERKNTRYQLAELRAGG